MATFHGKGGSVTFGGNAQAQVVSWTLNISVDLAESSAMDTANDYKDYLAGFKDWTATVEVHLDTGGPLAGTTAALTALGVKTTIILNDGQSTYTSTTGAILTDFTVTDESQDVCHLTLNYQGCAIIAVA